MESLVNLEQNPSVSVSRNKMLCFGLFLRHGSVKEEDYETESTSLSLLMLHLGICVYENAVKVSVSITVQ